MRRRSAESTKCLSTQLSVGDSGKPTERRNSLREQAHNKTRSKKSNSDQHNQRNNNKKQFDTNHAQSSELLANAEDNVIPEDLVNVQPNVLLSVGSEAFPAVLQAAP